MGKMNRLNTKLPNGDIGRDCDGDKDCHLPAYCLSWTVTPVGLMTKDGIQKYNQLIRYKCGNGHKFNRTVSITKNLL